MSAFTTGELPLTRYSVCLIASTFGSAAASLSRRTTVSNDSYGWCTRNPPSDFAMFSNMERLASACMEGSGGSGAALSDGLETMSASWKRSLRLSIPAWLNTSEDSNARCPHSHSRDFFVIPADTSTRTTRRRVFLRSAVWISSRRSSVASSSM